MILCVTGMKVCNASSDVDITKFDACFSTAENYYQVPKEILKAIAYVESRYNPNAYNQNINGTYDIGLMQINSTWLPKLATLNISEQMLYEPCQSIYMGAWVLANNIKTYGLNWTAVQRYNGNDIDLKYATKVYNRIQETYPTLLSPSQAKLIPINLKPLANMTGKIGSFESQKSRDADKNLMSGEIKQNDASIVIGVTKSTAQKVKTAEEYSSEVDDILRKSGAKSIPQVPPKILSNESSSVSKLVINNESLAKNSVKTEQIVANVLSKNVATFISEKQNNTDKLEKIEAASQIRVNRFFNDYQSKSTSVFLKNTLGNAKQNDIIKTTTVNENISNNLVNFVLDFNRICDKNIYKLCDFYFENIIAVTPRFLLEKTNFNIKKSPVSSRKSKKISPKNHQNKTAEMLVI